MLGSWCPLHVSRLSNCSKETAAKEKGFPVVFNIQLEYICSCIQCYSDTATYKTSCIHVMHQACTVRVAISSNVLYTLVEARCYGIGKIGKLLSNHVAVETDRNVRRFDRKGLRQIQFLVTWLHVYWRRPSRSKRLTFLSVSTAMWLLNNCPVLWFV